jgi:formiminotetrahydrofolate cyclodeaminase
MEKHDEDRQNREMSSGKGAKICRMYLDKPLQHFLDELASDKSTPGGGSASALCGAMGAALASMVIRLTLGKAGYADVQPEIEKLLQETENLRQRFQQLMQEDIDAYGKLSAAFKMPRSTPEESETRSKAIQACLVEAALVPLEMVESASKVVRCCRRIAEIGNANVLSDVATGSLLATSAANGAAAMVRVNLRAMKDRELVHVLTNRLNVALDDIAECSQQVTEIIGGRH